MLKKIGLVGGGIALLLALIFGRDTLSYVGTFVHGTRQAVRDTVPVEFEIARARDMVKGLVPEIKNHMHLIAKEEVDVARLRNQIKKQQEQLAKHRSDIERLTNDLKRGDSNYAYGGVMYTSKQVETDLSRRFEVYKEREAQLSSMKDLLVAREQKVVAANEELRKMESSKEKLLVEIEQMETRLALVRVAQASADLSIDDSSLARSRQLIDEISAKIEVQEKLAGAQTSGGHINIALEDQGQDDITQRVTEYFNGTSEGETPVVVKLD
jgi:chromosome segregation ATPase